ncbi:TPA: hypothetical protein ACFP4Y_001558 [Neisseria bacilliformis]
MGVKTCIFIVFFCTRRFGELPAIGRLKLFRRPYALCRMQDFCQIFPVDSAGMADVPFAAMAQAGAYGGGADVAVAFVV